MFQLMVLLLNTDDTFVTTLTIQLSSVPKIFQADDEENDVDGGSWRRRRRCSSSSSRTRTSRRRICKRNKT
jgi:hypothetical protein